MNWKHQTPFLIGIGSFALLAIFNEIRGFDLWRNYALSGILLGGSTVYALYRTDMRLPHYIQSIIVAALLSHYVGGSLGSPDPYRMGLLGMHGVNGAYHHFDWWDHLTHGLGIGASTMGIAYLLEVYQTRRGLEWSASALWIVSVLAGLAAGVAVELYEFLGKTAFQTIDQGGYENTMRDLHFNAIGSALGAGIAVSVNRSQFRQRIIDQWGQKDPVPRDAPWFQHTTPAMVGFVTFCGIPALAAIFLMTKFFTMELPDNDLHLYDPALRFLTIMAALGILLAPVGATIHRRFWRLPA